MPNIQLEILGNPVPQGSKRAFRAGNRLVVVDQQGEALRTYREAIGHAARQHMERPLRGPIELRIDFIFARPKGHFGKKGNILPSAPSHKLTKPDLDKLVRAVMDGLTHVAYEDDAQVFAVTAEKHYAQVPATYVLIEWAE